FMLLLATMLVFSACGNNEKKQSKEEEEEVVDKDKEEKEDEEEDEEDEEEEKEEGKSNDGTAKIDKEITYMEEETEGTAETIYESDEEQTQELEDVKVTMHGYELVELEDFHSNFQIPFNDQTDGGVLLTEYSVTNDSDDEVSYMPA